MRVAVRTTFNPGKITVKVSSDGLRSGEASVRSKKNLSMACSERCGLPLLFAGAEGFFYV